MAGLAVASQLRAAREEPLAVDRPLVGGRGGFLFARGGRRRLRRRRRLRGRRRRRRHGRHVPRRAVALPRLLRSAGQLRALQIALAGGQAVRNARSVPGIIVEPVGTDERQALQHVRRI